MKILMMIAVVAALAGCAPEKKIAAPDPLAEKVAALEKRVAAAEKKAGEMEAQAARLRGVVLTMIQTAETNELTLAKILQVTTGMSQDLTTVFVGHHAHVSDTNLHPFLRGRIYVPAVAPVKPKPPALTMGIPTEVYERIKAQSAADWPQSFSMQNSRILREVEAYKKVNP